MGGIALGETKGRDEVYEELLRLAEIGFLYEDSALQGLEVDRALSGREIAWLVKLYLAELAQRRIQGSTVVLDRKGRSRGGLRELTVEEASLIVEADKAPRSAEELTFLARIDLSRRFDDLEGSRLERATVLRLVGAAIDTLLPSGQPPLTIGGKKLSLEEILAVLIHYM